MGNRMHRPPSPLPDENKADDKKTEPFVHVSIDTQSEPDKSIITRENGTKSHRKAVETVLYRDHLDQDYLQRVKVIFMKIDKNGNGYINLDEFCKFNQSMGLKFTTNETKSLFRTIAHDEDNGITFEELCGYFAKQVMNESTSGMNEAKLRKAFLEADRNGTGALDFKEFVEYMWDKKRSIRVSKVIQSFDKMDKAGKGEVSYDQFRHFFKGRNSVPPPITEEELSSIQENDNLDVFDSQLKEAYTDTDGAELVTYIRSRWDAFASFKRTGVTGKVVMHGGHGMVADIVPGEYSLIDLACFSDLPPLIPKYTTLKGVQWNSSTTHGRSGKVVLPSDFDGHIVTEVATNELLRYYNCGIADSQQVKISLLYRHGIQDFTYNNRYLSDYVLSSNGGAGIEKHEFSHLDCPLEEDSGVFILAKLEGDEMQVTAFKVPVRHTLYVPGGAIHSNDYLKGTWRTMLSDETEIDHVHLVKKVDGVENGGYHHLRFTFD